MGIAFVAVLETLISAKIAEQRRRVSGLGASAVGGVGVVWVLGGEWTQGAEGKVLKNCEEGLCFFCCLLVCGFLDGV